MAYLIDLDPCINCGWCRRVCPTECIDYFTTGRRTHVINSSWCIDCQICVHVCPMDCISLDQAYAHDPGIREQAKEKARQWAQNRGQEEMARRQRAKALVARCPAEPISLSHWAMGGVAYCPHGG